MDKKTNVSLAVKELKEAGQDSAKQMPALFKLGECYLKEAKTTASGADFTKASALYNAALARSTNTNHEIDEKKIVRRIGETYREYLRTVRGNDGEHEFSLDEIQNEIVSHKDWLARERSILKERLNEIDSSVNSKEEVDRNYEIHAEKMCEVFRDIQDMYIRLVSMLATECESRLGKAPCDYAIIALGSVARMEATPYSDLEFAILYSDPTVGDKTKYFRELTHFLHLKVINLGETILPALGIEELNNFQSEHNDSWFYDSETPKGISFDGAMPWPSKTPLGRGKTKNKPALELIRTPEEMAKFQEEEVAVKEGYHLADIMSRAALLYGEESLLDEYNERVAEKLNTKSTGKPGKSTQTVGFMRGIEQMLYDVHMYNPWASCLGGGQFNLGGLLDAKKQFYRFISLLLLNLGQIFGIRCPSPWQVISELQTAGILSEAVSTTFKVCLSIANEIRLKTYFAHNGQNELFSPVSNDADVDPFRDFGEDVVIRLLSTSDYIGDRCFDFCVKYFREDQIDMSVFQNLSAIFSNAVSVGYLYYRLQNFAKALEWFKSEPEDSPEYAKSLVGRGAVHWELGEVERSVECYENALQVNRNANGQDRDVSKLGVVVCLNALANNQTDGGNYEAAITMLKEAIGKYHEIFGEEIFTRILGNLKQNLGYVYSIHGDTGVALVTFREVRVIQKALPNVPVGDAIQLNLNMAWLYSKLKDVEQSLEHIDLALQDGRKAFGEHNLSIGWAQICNAAGVVYDRLSLDEKAECMFKRSLDTYRSVHGDSPHRDKIDVLKNLGSSLAKRNKLNEAKEVLESGVKQARSICDGKPTIELAEVLNTLGAVLRDAEKWKDSLPYLLEAKEVMDKMLEPGHLHLRTSDILHNMGTVYVELEDLAEAFQCFKNALDMKSAIFGENDNSDTVVANCFNLAYTAELMENFGEAKKYYTKAINTESRIPLNGNTCRSYVALLNRLSAACKALGQEDEALQHSDVARHVEKVAGMNWEAINLLLNITNMSSAEMATDLSDPDSSWPSDADIQELIESCNRV